MTFDKYQTKRDNKTRWGKKKLGNTSDFGGGVPDAEEGQTVWVENGVVYTSPTVDPNKFGGHAYDNGGYESGIRDCPCGAYMLSSSSGGPVDPFGPCPLNPQAQRRIVYGFYPHGFKIRVMDGTEKLREVGSYYREDVRLDTLEQQVVSIVTGLAEEYKIDYDWRDDSTLNTLVRDNSILKEDPKV